MRTSYCRYLGLCNVLQNVCLHFHSARRRWWDGRQISVDGTMFRDGTVAASVNTHSKHFLRACRGGALAIGNDASGRARWAVHLPGNTAGSEGDVFTSSTARRAHNVNVDAAAAAATTAVTVIFDYANDSLERRFKQAVDGIGRSVKAATDAL